ncbi:hypothetical protein KP509_33G045500 [Ceratopteris richardii]|uniref:Uncharacterized protein n=1 Tax=Ceratopteris richardii TaxID=49495 RepID=A0A8T2QPK4_CERRI|nr:hypothetical protein KP509_33G045500 [Ceratopteris richardii]
MTRGHLYALDFDGILCDSCGESSISALKAAKSRWPEIFVGVDQLTESWILKAMHMVRPVVETGYENVLLVRLLLESKIPASRKTSIAEGLSVDKVLKSWSSIKPVIMSDWGEENRDDLIDLFGKVRDDWITNDLQGWICANRFYPGVTDALKFATSKIYIVTTKQARFAQILLKELAGIDLGSEFIYGLGSGPKVEVLKKLQSQPEHQDLILHFVEDRVATLHNVIKEPMLQNWNLYLGSWGYNTTSEREEAEKISRITLLDLPEFCEKFK